MAEALEIRTGKFTKSGKVDIDGKIWDVRLPGTGTELRFSQAQRALKLYEQRIKILDKKIDDGTITEEELDKYEEYSAKYDENTKIIMDTFTQTFNDGTPDNKHVKKWVNDTPTAIIMLAFEDIQTAGEAKNDEVTDATDKETPAQN